MLRSAEIPPCNQDCIWLSHLLFKLLNVISHSKASAARDQWSIWIKKQFTVAPPAQKSGFLAAMLDSHSSSGLDASASVCPTGMVQAWSAALATTGKVSCKAKGVPDSADMLVYMRVMLARHKADILPGGNSWF